MSREKYRQYKAKVFGTVPWERTDGQAKKGKDSQKYIDEYLPKEEEEHRYSLIL